MLDGQEGDMRSEDGVKYLRGFSSSDAAGDHPILELTDEELRRVVGGVDMTQQTVSAATGSYPDPTPGPPCTGFCCDGVKVCCK